MSGTADHYRASFERFAAERLAGEPEWLAARRREALEHFAEVGFPTTRWEEWRYTNVSAIAAQPFEPAPLEHDAVHREEIERLCQPVFACGLVVFVDGRYDAELSSFSERSDELRVHGLLDLWRENPTEFEQLLGGAMPTAHLDWKPHPFAALNRAFTEDGAAVIVPKGRASANPVHVVFVSTPSAGPVATHPRVLVHAEAGSQVTVIQDHVSIGGGPRLSNAVTEVRVDANAQVDLVLLQREADDVFQISNLQARLERDARLRCHTVTLGGALVRNDLAAVMVDEGAECDLRALYLGTGDRVVDNHTLVDHASPHCASHELYKGILADESRGVFRGRVVVRPDAQKTDATQHNPNLLLSDGAEVDSKPQLEIFADDVKCSHGSTIGQLDVDALFYLRARGLPLAQARDLLTRGFAAEIARGLPSEVLGELVTDLLLERLLDSGGPR